MTREKNRASRDLTDCGIRAIEGETRRFELSFSSEEPYERWYGTEILDHSADCVNLDRLNSIGVLLYNHNRDDVVGRIVDASVVEGRGRATVEFDSDDLSEKIYQKVQSGTLKGVSVGYMVDTWEEVMPNKKSLDGRFTGPCSIAKRWTPYEISIVSVPADPTVGVGREFESGGDEMVISDGQLQIETKTAAPKKEEKGMNLKQMLARLSQIRAAAEAESRDLTADEQNEINRLQRQIAEMVAAGETVDSPEQTQPDADSGDGDTAKRAVEEERGRIREITEMCSAFGIDSRSFIENGSTVDQARAAVLDQLKKQAAPIGSRIEVTATKEDKFRAAASDALLMRAGMHVENPAEGARQMMGMSLRDIAVESLAQDGSGDISSLYRKNGDELYSMLQRGFFNPESAFPAILDQTIEKAYVEGHRQVPVTFDKWTKKGSLSDFKTHDNYYIAGPVGEFLEVPENGELKHDVFSDDKLPQRKLKTYGRQFTLSRKAFIDDDIALVTSIPARYAASARKTINKQVYEILLNNPAIYDGVALFGAAHSNLLGEGTGVTQDAMQTMMMALANQTDQFGQSIIINPAYIIVPSGMQFEIYTLFNSPYIETSDNTQAVNPLYGYRTQLQIIEDPTINVLCGGLGNTMPWFLVGAPSDTDFIEVDYLNGQEIPNIRRMETPGQLGFVWDIYLDWGISVMDYRGAVKNPGTTVSTAIAMATE